jgi:hypothetical protein
MIAVRGKWTTKSSGFANPVAADALLHPFALAAVAALILNDHVAKQLWPGLLTGKVSDFAGMMFFPLLLVGTWEVAVVLRGRTLEVSPTPIVAATLATGVVFILVKTSALGAASLGWGLGLGQWLAQLLGVIAGAPVPPISPVVVVRDPSDLIALPALAVALAIGLSRARTSRLGRTTVGLRA